MSELYELEELVPIVAKLTDKYTSKESSSISYEKARMLMEAVNYSIEEFYNDNDNAVSSVTRIDAVLAYEKGYEKVINKVKKAKDLYDTIIKDFDAYNIICYYDTIIKGMPAFFMYYDAKFCPQDHILTLDYPTIISVQDKQGINAIYDYLYMINLEQIFLNKFNRQDVVKVLVKYNEDYKGLLINVANIVLRNLIMLSILGKKVDSLEIDKDDYQKIKQIINCNSKENIVEIFNKSIKEIVKWGYKDNNELLLYLSYGINDFYEELRNCVEYDCLNAMF